MDAKLLRKYQHYRVDCKYREDKPRKGLWCNKIKDKCSFYNCKEYDSPPLISDGKYNSKKRCVYKKERNDGTGLSKEEMEAYEYVNKGKSLSWISNKMNCSKSTVHRRVEKYKAFIKANKGVPKRNDKPIMKKRNDFFKRLHNDSVSFLIDPIDLSMERDVIKLRYDSYKLIKYTGLHIQVFSKKLIVRFLDDIVAKSIGECKRLADERIVNFLKRFNYKGISFLNNDFEQVSRHYAIIGTGLAKKVVKEKRKFFVFDKDNEKRFEVDFSNRVPESEFVHAKKSDVDSVNGEKFFDVLLDKVGSYDLPDVTKAKLDLLLAVQERYAKNIELHLSVLNQMERTLRKLERKL